MNAWLRKFTQSSSRIGALVLVIYCCQFTWIGTVEAARVVAEKRECATCHIAWMSDFKRKDVATLIPHEPRPVVETGKQNVVSTELMCFSCHDGFTLDSRQVWLETRHSHPVGVVPSDKVNLSKFAGKEVFPLNDDGKVYCGTCHSAHGLSWQEKESPIFLRLPNVASSLCMTCHANKSEVNPGVNHPITVGLEPLGLESVPEQLTAAGGIFTKDKEITCQSCHTPHAASSRPLMVVDNRQTGLCKQCHVDKAHLSGTKHDMTAMAPDMENSKGESVSEYGPCLACHVLHHADNTAPLWGREAIASEEGVEGVCKSCHNKEGPAHKKTIAAHSHPTDVSIDKLGITPHEDKWESKNPVIGTPLLPLPLYEANGQEKTKEPVDPYKPVDSKKPLGTQVSCPTCHDLHNWSATSKEKGDPKKTDGDGQSSFLRIAQGTNSALCINCHVDKRSVLMSKHNLQSQKTRNKLQQASTVKARLDQGVCGSCHRAHNGLGPLMTPMKRKDKQSTIQTICTTCHMGGGIANRRLTGRHSHPLLRNLSRVGGKTSLPLFNQSGQRHTKGRVDCATCHNPHQWDPTNILSTAGKEQKVNGDARTSFLRKPAAPGSDLCVDCHRNKRPVRGTDHDLRVTASHATDIQGRTVEQTGVCGQCHSVHNAPSRLMLWARKTPPGQDPQIALCLSCHSEGGAAESKIPKEVMRPHNTVLWSNKMRAQGKKRYSLPDIPVFNSRGNRALVGRLKCASCHNPHIWDADVPREGKGKNIEGNVANSFLRNSSSKNIVCVDCHGVDGLFRYKYFHGEVSNRPHSLYR